MLMTGLSLVFFVEFVRALPWPERWKKRKPLSCDACMVGWPMLAYLWGEYTLTSAFTPETTLASGGLALLALAALKHWKGLSLLPPE